MLDTSSLLLFVSASLVLLLIPGPAVLFIVARSVEQGRAAGVASALGLSVGSAIQVIAAAAGLSALVVSSALAFAIIKYVGAAYLVFLALRTLLASSQPAAQAVTRVLPMRRIFTEGVVVNLLNPKLAIFFLAFLPTFVDPARGSPVLQIVVLGSVFVALGTLTDITYAVVVSGARRLAPIGGPGRRAGRTASGLTYLGLGLYTALSSSERRP